VQNSIAARPACRKIHGFLTYDDVVFMDWRRILAYITGTVDEELLLRNEYLAAENRILMEQLKRRVGASANIHVPLPRGT